MAIVATASSARRNRRPRRCLPLGAAIALGVVTACSSGTREAATSGAAPTATQSSAVVGLGWAGELVFARTEHGRLLSWDLTAAPPKTVAAEGVVGLSADGATVASARGSRLTIWEPRSGAVLGARDFVDGVVAVEGVGHTIVVLEIRLPAETSASYAMAKVPPRWEQAVVWDFRENAITRLPEDRCLGAISPDEGRVFCGFTQYERGAEGNRPQAIPEFAMDWSPSAYRPAQGGRPSAMRLPGSPTLDVESARYASDGRAIYFTYVGLRDEHAGHSRLERWLLELDSGSSGRIERLVESRGPTPLSVLASSGDDRAVVAAELGHAPRLHLAPTWDGVALASPPARAAAFSADGTRLVTGHDDGTLRLWERSSAKLLVISRRPP